MFSYAWCYALFLVSSNESSLSPKLYFCLMARKRSKEAYIARRWAWENETQKIFYQTPVCLPCPLFKYLINFDISSTSEVFCVVLIHLSIRHSNNHHDIIQSKFSECNLINGLVKCNRIGFEIEFWKLESVKFENWKRTNIKHG